MVRAIEHPPFDRDVGGSSHKCSKPKPWKLVFTASSLSTQHFADSVEAVVQHYQPYHYSVCIRMPQGQKTSPQPLVTFMPWYMGVAVGRTAASRHITSKRIIYKEVPELRKRQCIMDSQTTTKPGHIYNPTQYIDRQHFFLHNTTIWYLITTSWKRSLYFHTGLLHQWKTYHELLTLNKNNGYIT